MSEPSVDEVSTSPQPKEKHVGPNPINAIQEALQGLRFGQVTVVVHEGTVVQIERLEKRRIHPTSD
jgi:hypothetical protein